MNQLLFLLETGTDGGGTGGFSAILLLYGAIFAIFWFFLIRPQRKKQKLVESMQQSIAIGDSILTSGGLYGKVIDLVNPSIVVIEFGTNKSVRVALQRSAIASIAEPDMTKEIEEEVK